MAEDPAAWSRLLDKIADTTRLCLKAQAEAGVDMVQVFDSWAGALDRTDYVNSVLPATRHLFGALKDSLSLPVVNFSTGTAGIIEEVASAGGDVLGVDWRMPLDRVHERIGGRPLQGNLDPVALLSDEKSLLARVDRILDEARDLPGHIFNLGHGVLPQTDPDRIAAVIRRVHERTRA